MLALGQRLVREGHPTTVATAPNFEMDARALGLEFHPVGRDVQRFLQESRADFSGSLRGARFLASLHDEECRYQFEGLFALKPDFDVVVAGGAQVAASSLAEHWKKPYRYVAYFPGLLPSRFHPPMFLPPTLPRFANSWLWKMFGERYQARFGKVHAEHRARHGMAPLPHVLEHMGQVDSCVLAVDPELAPAPPDLSQVAQVGAFHLDDATPLPRELVDFIESGEPPVYLGFGSMPDPHPARTSELLMEAVQRAGLRAIISSGWANLSAAGVDERVRFCGPVNHGRLLPKMRASVHHGGAGTTAASARAGIPQVLVPHSFDQFAWARSTVTAGVSPGFLSRSALTPKKLAHLLERAVGDSRHQERARVLGSRIQKRDATGDAVKILTQTVRSFQR